MKGHELDETNPVPVNQDRNTRIVVSEYSDLAQQTLMNPLTVSSSSDAKTQLLLIWDDIPERTTYHLIDFDPVYCTVHGKLLGMMGLTEEEGEIIQHLAQIKGSPVETLKLPANVTHFVETGWYL